jgi:predicted unusual protein kinase regulating ubiquinone biosynthesis (AarF/ABC1/UbiB family)
VLHDGRRVAVKVRRPGIEALLMADIALMYKCARLLKRSHLLGGTRLSAVVDELGRWTREELDFTTEAANARVMRAHVRDPATEYEPEILDEYSSRRVLTSELLEGVLLLDVVRGLRADRDATVRRLREAGHDPERAAANLVWNFLGQAYAIGVFHGDLHPANLFLLKDDRIGYVDFGIIGRIPAAVHDSLGRFAMSLFGEDAEAAVDELMVWMRPSLHTDQAAARAELVARTQAFLAEFGVPGAPRRDLLTRFQIDLLSAGRRHRMSVDRSVVLYMKTVATIDAVTYELAPTLDLQALHERFFGGLIVEGIGSTRVQEPDV